MVKRRPTAIRRSRAERYAAGMSPRDIANADGVTVGVVHQSLSGLVSRAADWVEPGAPLPDGYEWFQRTDGTWYAVSRLGARTTPDSIRWALAQFDAERVCPTCGRPL